MILTDINPQSCAIVDLRWADQYATGHIDGSLNIPSDQILSHLDPLRAMGRPIILCCQSGFRARQAAHVLRNCGLDVVWATDYRSLGVRYGLPIISF